MIPIARPLLGESEADAARHVILSGWLTQGAEVAAFEQEFAAAVDAPFACAVSSCTAALDLALRVLGVGPGDEVVTVSHSFIAAANAIRNRGATPVFVDIEPETFNLDPERLEGAFSSRTRAILCVHQMGMPCDLGRILPLALARKVPVIEDAACAIGAEIALDGRWSRIGKPHGDIGCFSFHPRKVITTGEGGMLTTANPDWDRQFRALRQHGMNIAADARHAAASVVFETYASSGYNYRMTDIQAAVGRRQLTRLDAIVADRRRLAARYRRLLGSVKHPAEPPSVRSNWQSYCVRLPDRMDQRRFMQALLDRGIATRRGIMCAHREPAFADLAHGPLPESERAQDRCVLLPLYPLMSEAEQDEVMAAVDEACAA
jgi:dTDP-4-amino-4,6-dideoxygalactose transaminase